MGGKTRPGTGLRDKRIPPGETIADINRVSRAFGRSDEHGSARRPRRPCRKAAHRFAGAFPMPAEALRAEMGVRRSSIGWSELFVRRPFSSLRIHRARRVPVDVVVHLDTHRDPRASNLIWCRGWGSNPHGPHGPRDFKSRVSTSSTTSASAAPGGCRLRRMVPSRDTRPPAVTNHSPAGSILLPRYAARPQANRPPTPINLSKSAAARVRAAAARPAANSSRPRPPRRGAERV